MSARAIGRSLATILLLAAPPAAVQAQAPDASEILGRAIAAYRDVRTLRANFTQSVQDPMIGSSETSRGELLQQRPDRFAMRWSEPRGDLLVVDGQFLWVYLPSSAPNQVVKSQVVGRPGQNPDVIAEFLDNPRDRFTVTYVRSEPVGSRPTDVLAFVPKAANTAYRRVLLWLDSADALPRRVEITEASGTVRRITLDRLRVNTALPPSTFTFRPPQGVRVVDATR
jgi:outer membrane lipoprotein carrier protein